MRARNLWTTTASAIIYERVLWHVINLSRISYIHSRGLNIAYIAVTDMCSLQRGWIRFFSGVVIEGWFHFLQFFIDLTNFSIKWNFLKMKSVSSFKLANLFSRQHWTVLVRLMKTSFHLLAQKGSGSWTQFMMKLNTPFLFLSFHFPFYNVKSVKNLSLSMAYGSPVLKCAITLRWHVAYRIVRIWLFKERKLIINILLSNSDDCGMQYTSC